MSNNLTGDYDAVLLVSVTKINGILATLHQNGADPDASPVSPHSEKTRIGDPPPILHPPLSDYAGWFNEMLQTVDGGGDPGTQGPNSPATRPLALRGYCSRPMKIFNVRDSTKSFGRRCWTVAARWKFNFPPLHRSAPWLHVGGYDLCEHPGALPSRS